MRAKGRAAAFAVAAAFACWCGGAQAYRPFDGTDAAVAEPGQVEIEFAPAEYPERLWATCPSTTPSQPGATP
jgi:hypothetical protein